MAHSIMVAPIMHAPIMVAPIMVAPIMHAPIMVDSWRASITACDWRTRGALAGGARDGAGDPVGHGQGLQRAGRPLNARARAG